MVDGILVMKSLLFALLFGVQSLSAGEVCIVASRTLPLQHISRSTLKAIYLDKKHLINGHKVLPINYTFTDPLRSCFEKHVLKKSRRSLERYWLRAHYNGKRAPKVVKSKAALLAYLQKVPGTIGYVDSKTARSTSLKVLLRIPCD